MLPRKALEGKHRNFTHQQPAEQQHEQEQEQRIETRTSQPCFTTRQQRPPKNRISRRRHPNESRMLTFINIKLRQTQSGESRHKESRERHHTEKELRAHPYGISHMVEQREEHRRRSHTKGDTISQRIKFNTQLAAYAKSTSRHAIEEIEESTQQDKQESKLIAVVESRIGCNTSTNQIATSNDIWYMLFHLNNVLYDIHVTHSRSTYPPSSNNKSRQRTLYCKRAISVSSPTVACPIFTSTSVPSGRYTSTRLPNLMKPMWSSMKHSSPSFA